MSILDRVVQRVRDKGLREGTKAILRDAGSHVVDANREVILLRLDLANPKAHRKKKELERYDFEIAPFEERHFDKIAAMLRSSEPSRIDQIRLRIDEGTPGFVTFEKGDVVAYVFYEANVPGRRPYPDLEWLQLALSDKEVYSFDSFIPPALRGRGIPMLRATYQALHDKGFEAAYGYVWAWDTAPLWSYRVTGWEEIGRLHEHRIAGRLALVDGTLYKLNRFNRERLFAVPLLQSPKRRGMPHT